MASYAFKEHSYTSKRIDPGSVLHFKPILPSLEITFILLMQAGDSDITDEQSPNLKYGSLMPSFLSNGNSDL